jgi:predicted enzyme related to lactoylglutathione lyase
MHFEILGEDFDRLKRFYSELFGWRFEIAPLADDYYLIQTAEKDEGQNITQIDGGLTKAESSIRGFINYFSVECLDESCEKIKALGGKILTPKQEVFDMGWSVLAEDPEGNIFAIWKNII